MTSPLIALRERERVRAATGADRELDAAIWLACFEPQIASFDVTFHVEQYDNYLSRTSIETVLGGVWVDEMDPPLRHYTASLDAVVALIERKLPGWRWNLNKQSHATMAMVFRPGGSCEESDDSGAAMLATPALALCAALLSALIEQEGAG